METISIVVRDHSGMRNHITYYLFVRYRAIIAGLLTRNTGFFHTLQLVSRTIRESNLKTLFTSSAAFLTLEIMLSSAVGIEKECPFVISLLASAHRQSRSEACFNTGAVVRAVAFSLAVCSLAWIEVTSACSTASRI